MRKIILFVFLSLCVLGNVRKPLPKEPIQLRLSLFNSMKVKQLVMTHNRGHYKIKGDGQLIGEFKEGDFINYRWIEGKIKISLKDKILGRFKEIRFEGTGYANSFKVRILKPQSEVRIYEDDLVLKSTDGRIRLINEPELNHYIAGVVESEVGKNAHLEYYKLQSILCRTYALSNRNKHAHEGFNLCDEVHCQVYKGKSISNRDILKATAATSGLVVIDNELNLITATFHSNCGGHTVNSEDVWSSPLHYLRGVRDTFCHAQPHALWEKTVALDDWKSYLTKRFAYPFHNETLHNWVTNYHQSERDVFFTPKEIPLKTIRKDWMLNSTYFSIEVEQDSVRFRGRGFGHGVGLCQEGAMKMAEYGYSYKSILNHYYKNVNLVNLRALRFVKEE